jgi:hypothetical protein
MENEHKNSNQNDENQNNHTPTQKENQKEKKMKILQEFESESHPGKSYKIIEGGDGVIYCECWAWKKKRQCKHLDKYFLGWVRHNRVPPPSPTSRKLVFDKL